MRGLAQDATDAGRDAFLHRVRVLANVYSQVLLIATPQAATPELTFSAVLSVLVSMLNAVPPEQREGLKQQIMSLIEGHTDP